MTTRTGVCPACGAHLSKEDKVCQLCGEVIAPAGIGAADTEENSPEANSAQLPAAAAVFQELPKPVEAADADSTKPETGVAEGSSGIGAIVLLAGLLLVVGLYLISSVSGSKPAEVPDQASVGALAPPPEPEVPPLRDELVQQVATIRAEADRRAGTSRLDKLRELAVLYQTEGRYDLAGDVQTEIAAESSMEIDWVRAGNLYYDWMESRQGPGKSYYAKKAITSYQEALTINPNNLDVRTDMAVAYLFDPDNPMQAIINTNQVLQADSMHLQANFNRGIMLMQINRMEDAVTQFKKVMRLEPEPTHPVHQRASEAIRLIESRSEGNAP
ncbi:MAG: hypothetical protein HKN43_03835 [Rhodothermales bacterium]|nr:hypothetical protein [Rhodothermales bacterium]